MNGNKFNTFREACYARGLLDDDNEFISTIKEASKWSTGHSLRRLFVSMLLCSCVQRPEHVWDSCKKLLSEDQMYIPRNHPSFAGIAFVLNI